MKKTGVIIVSTAAVAAATGLKLWLSHQDAKERAKWKQFWDERHTEAAEARAKAVASVKEAAEKGKKEVVEAYSTLSDAATETVKNVADTIKPVDEKKEVLEDLHGGLTNYLAAKKSEEVDDSNSETVDDSGEEDSDGKKAEAPEASADEEERPSEEDSTEEAGAKDKVPAPPVDNDSDEEPLPAWDSVPVIGDGAGQISPTSEEYVALLKEAIEKAEKEPTYHLVLSGKTYGLGAKGKSIGGDTAYDLEALRKLLRKTEQTAE